MDEEKQKRPPSYNTALNQDYTPADIGWNPQRTNYNTITTSEPSSSGDRQEPVINRVIFLNRQFGEYPLFMKCNHCKVEMMTTVSPKASPAAHALCFLCILFGCILGCCLIPYCMDGCTIYIHRCSFCGNYCGESQR